LHVSWQMDRRDQRSAIQRCWRSFVALLGMWGAFWRCADRGEGEAWGLHMSWQKDRRVDLTCVLGLPNMVQYGTPAAMLTGVLEDDSSQLVNSPV
jgi:hypothetical protein